MKGDDMSLANVRQGSIFKDLPGLRRRRRIYIPKKSAPIQTIAVLGSGEHFTAE